MQQTLACSLALAVGAAAQLPPAHSLHAVGLDRAAVAAVESRSGWPFEAVLYDEAPGGQLWASGSSWKASFDAGGFTFVPFLGSDVPSQPVNFQLAAVRVGGRPLPLSAGVAPRRSGDRVTFDRGLVQEIYELRLDEVEQLFVVDAQESGDVEVELAVTSALVEDTATEGIQLAGPGGGVDYGAAFLVRGAEKLPIHSAWTGNGIRFVVPAATRGAGPVVIDPILSSRTTSASGPVSAPDVAYDVTTDRYLVVWENAFSTTDHDIWTEMFDGDGNLIPGSGAAIDFTSLYTARPRAGNLNAADRFLVAFEYLDPSYANRRMIYGRTRDAGGNMAVGPWVLFSNPAVAGENYGPEIGSDPATGFASHDWLVVWTNVASSTDANVQARAVQADGQPKHPWHLNVEDGVGTYNGNAQVSRSNGNGMVLHPAWFIVYTRYEGNYAKIYGRTLDLSFALGNEVPIDDSNNRSLYPQVSSPIVNDDETSYMVTWERQETESARAAVVHFRPAWTGTNFYYLTTQFGVAGVWLRVESDGFRFVVVSQGSPHELVVRTLGWGGSGLWLQDGPLSLGFVLTEPEIVACRNSGGAIGRYGITWIRLNSGGTKTPVLTRYGGYMPGSTVTVQATGCNGLALEHSGSPLLGDAMHFQLQNFGGDLPILLFGTPTANPVPLCPPCGLGLRVDLPIAFIPGSTLSLAVPPLAWLAGESFAVQGASGGTGPCFGAWSLSDTVGFTVR